MLLLTQGDAGIDCCDPFVGALQKRHTVHKYGPHIVICDLLIFAVKDGMLLSYCLLICFTGAIYLRYFLDFRTVGVAVLFFRWCAAIGSYDARVRVLAKYLNLYLGVSFDKFEEIEDIIVKNFADENHEPTE